SIEKKHAYRRLGRRSQREERRPHEGVVPRADVLQIDHQDVDLGELVRSWCQPLVAVAIERDHARTGAVFATVFDLRHVLRCSDAGSSGKFSRPRAPSFSRRITACRCRSLYRSWDASPSSLADSVSRSMIWNSASTKITGPSVRACGGAASSTSCGTRTGRST